MKKRLLVGAIFLISALVAYGQTGGTQRQATTNSATPAAPAQKALVDQYCVTCHNDRAKIGNLSLENQDFTRVSQNAELWEKVIRKLRAGVMPPPGVKRPDQATHEALTVWLETAIDRTASARPNPGTVELHRLNRSEYSNAILDLLGLEVDASSLLPTDDSTNGFDNQAGALALSPALLEAYISAAAKISRMAVGRWVSPTEARYIPPPDTSQDYHIPGLPFGTRGGMLIRHTFPADGEYTFNIQSLNTGTIVPGEQLEVLLDGERIKLYDWDAQTVVTLVNDRPEQHMELTIPVKAGTHTIGATFLATNFRPHLDMVQHYERSSLQNYTVPGFTFYAHVGFVQIKGPFNPTGATDLPSISKIFTCRPTSATDEPACAKQIVSNLARRAFRRPSNSEDLEFLMSYYEQGRKAGDFTGGIELALRRILADPEFVFRTEAEPANVKPGQTYRISDLELASRISFFLWSTGPDDALINIANQGKLKDPKVLEQQVRRMIADPRASALVSNFAVQWLSLRTLTDTSPAQEFFPNWDDTLRQAFRTETEMFFDSIVREDRNVVDLLTADYTFVNERLARHYGIKGITGSRFQRVTLGPDLDMRRGLLGKGSILTITSLSIRNSPVVRGKWVLQTILGTNPPNPPPNVPPLDKTSKEGAGKVLTLREQMEAHRESPACSGCHKIMDPIGFSMENFNADGSWRTREGGDGGAPIVSSGELFDGTKIDGPASLRQALLHYSPQFVRAFTEKLMTYALGRGVEYYDMPVVRSIVRDAARTDNRFSSIVLGIVKSPPFQMKVKSQDVAVRD